MSSEKRDDIENTANRLLNEFENPDTAREVSEVQQSDPLQMLRSDILSFFRTHMQRIQKQEDLRNGVQGRLQEMVENGELTFDQLMKIFQMVTNQENTASDSIISLFRPVPGVGSLLANAVGSDKSNDEVEDLYDSLSPDQTRKIDELYRRIQQEMSEE